MSDRFSWITGGESDPTAILCSVNYNQIATVNDALDGWEENANLIRSAPRLLHAAQRVIDAFNALGRANNFSPTSHQECQAAMLALDATVAEIKEFR